MHGRRIVALVIAVVLTALPGSAAVPDDYVPTFARSDNWLHANESRIGNLDARDGKFVRWDGTEPTAPAAAAYVGNNFGFVQGDHDPAHFLTMKGQATGDLENLAFELYFTGWAQATDFCPMALSFELVIDGIPVLWQNYAGSDGITYEAVDATTSVTRFALTNLWQAARDYGLPYGPDVVHEVYVNVQNFYACNEVTWLYDSVDHPSALTVNLPEPAAAGYVPIDVLDPPPPPS